MKVTLGVGGFSVCVGFLFLIVGCNAEDSSSSGPGPLEPATLVDSATSLMQRYSLRGDDVDWQRLRETARNAIDSISAPDVADAHAVIRQALAMLDDGHSMLVPSEMLARFSSDGDLEPEPIEVRLLEPGVGYARIPAFLAQDSAQLAAYAASTQSEIRRLGEPGPCAWVVDLRGNMGGNMWPMLASLGPILGNGTAGFFIGADGATPWGYTNGRAWEGSDTIVAVTNPRPIGPAPVVAVLTDSLTASSGEAMAIAFRGRLGTRTFGGPTAGLTTANEVYDLPDGSLLAITVAVQADRDRREYHGPIEPDETTADPVTLDQALAWLRSTADC